MKKVLWLMLFCISVSLSAQETSEEELSFTKVVQADNKSKSELYPIIKTWVASSFKSARDVIQLDDENNGILVCRGSFDYKCPGGINYMYIAGYVTYTLKIQVKDGRYKVDMSKFSHYSTSTKYTEEWCMGLITTREKYRDKALYKIYNKAWADVKVKSENEFNTIAEDLEKTTSGKKETFEENW